MSLLRILYKNVFAFEGGYQVEMNQSCLSYVALGDSLTVGVGASFLTPGFVGRYARLTEKTLDRRVITNIFAKSGIESGGVLDIVSSEPLHDKINRANIITITAGGNDLIQASKDFIESRDQTEIAQSVKECHSNMMKIMETIHELKKDCGVPFIVYLLNLYNPLPQITLADKWVRLFNQQLSSFDNKKTIRVVDIYTVFKDRQEELLSGDRIHPNSLGYQEMANTLVQLGYPKEFNE